MSSSAKFLAWGKEHGPFFFGSVTTLLATFAAMYTLGKKFTEGEAALSNEKNLREAALSKEQELREAALTNEKELRAKDMELHAGALSKEKELRAKDMELHAGALSKEKELREAALTNEKELREAMRQEFETKVAAAKLEGQHKALELMFHFRNLEEYQPLRDALAAQAAAASKLEKGVA